MARQRRSNQPTDAGVDAYDQTMSPEANDNEHDAPDVHDVLQVIENAPAVRVEVDHPVRVDQLPTSIGGSRTWALVQNRAQRVAKEDPRRSAITFAAISGSVQIGRTQAEAIDPATAFTIPPSVGAFRFHFKDEVYAYTTAAAASLSVMVEQWTR